MSAEIGRLDTLIDQLEGRLASARMTEADLETRMAAIRRGVERLPEQPPERQREVITALVADVSLAAGQPLRLRVWPSPDAELQETYKKETPVREFVRVSALVGSRRRRTNTADLVEVAFGTEMVRGERRQWVVRTTGLLAG